MKKALLILMVVVPQLLWAQKGANHAFLRTDYLTIEPLSIINFQTPKIKIGFNKNITPRWDASITLGYGHQKFAFPGSEVGSRYRLYELRNEWQYQAYRYKRYRYFLGIEVFYIHHTDVYYASKLYNVDDDYTLAFNHADFRRQKMGLLLKNSFQFLLSDKIGIHMYTGLGFRVRKNAFTNVDPVWIEFDDEDSRYLFEDHYNTEEGTEVSPDLAAGFKFIYVLKYL
ncbi:hypothetical protein [Fulvivirga ligni]|uniref:hypothetical protein n=1 Tax=Fulvivirga ligni TaxID=2904246 RepID=UPI001F430EF6|nr:hypothetical protein [Fulvivirga ligni]UII20369.1 hypothetical protein LVD16_21230 [Fulvivirga ligni]